MIARTILPEVQRCATEYPVVTITGPRQSGKTTLARSAFPGHDYVNFERPDQRALFDEDPRGFLANHARGAVFDEVQWVPDICSWLQDLVDRDRSPGRFILTGSQHFGLTGRVAQSLAGRTAVLELLPFSAGELEAGGCLAGDLDTALWTGSYPPIHDRGLRPDRWYADYLATYLERDLRQLSTIQDLSLFQRFLKLAAGNVGQLLRASRLAGDVGVDQKTIERWFSLLEASYLAVRLPPFLTNVRKRLTRSPKIYFLDTGLVCHLLGIHEPQQLAAHPLRGAVFENWVAAELLKQATSAGRRPQVSFWRTYDGQEIDLVRQDGNTIELIECKAGQTVHPRFLGPIKHVAGLLEEHDVRGRLIHGGDQALELGGVQITPWRRLALM
jgi:uncharacterized protein